MPRTNVLQVRRNEVTDRGTRAREKLVDQQLQVEINLSKQERAAAAATTAQTPTYVVIDSTDSPYTLVDNETTTVDMSGGDVTVVLPASADYGLGIIRDGSSNTLTIQGTLNGTVDGTLDYDKSAIQIIWDGTNYWIT